MKNELAGRTRRQKCLHWPKKDVRSALIPHISKRTRDQFHRKFYNMSLNLFQAQYRRILSCRCVADSPSPRFGQQLQAHKKMNGGGVGGHHNTNNHRSGGLLHQRQAQSCRIPMAMTRYCCKPATVLTII